VLSPKILFLIDDLGSGGAQNQITLLAKNLAERGFHIDFVTYFNNDFFKFRLEHPNINTIDIPKKSKIGFGVIFGLIKLKRYNRYVSSLSYLDTPNFYNTISSLLSFTTQNTIISYRSTTNFKNMPLEQKLLKKVVNYLADSIVCNSFHEKSNWVKESPILANKIYSIYNTVDFYQKNFEAKPTDKLRIVVVGTVSPYKNGQLVVEALNLIKGKIGFHLTWFGRKYLSNPDKETYFGDLNEKIRRYELTEYWQWRDPVSNLKELLNEFDLMILASNVEGLPNVLCEAQACSLPVIASNTLDHPLLINDGFNGLLFKPNDATSLANAILSFSKFDLNHLSTLRKNSYLSAVSKFNKENILKKYAEILRLDI
jgi:GalNAc-alpha-(1->4)-GalNAc-alpha-(1->3)-diNAcBac-PP-undecaprenol alpha-1,4-N-acetyl-D-galactosaminyltransferase